MSAKWFRPWDPRGDERQKWEAQSEEAHSRAEEGGSGGDNHAAAEEIERVIDDLEEAIEAWDGADQHGPEGHGSAFGAGDDHPAVAEEGDGIEEVWEEDRAEPPQSSIQTGDRPQPSPDFSSGVELSRQPLGWNGKPKGRGLVKPDEVRLAFSPHERLLILDTWQRSGLPAGDFAPLVGLSKHTLYLWKKRFTRTRAGRVWRNGRVVPSWAASCRRSRSARS